MGCRRFFPGAGSSTSFHFITRVRLREICGEFIFIIDRPRVNFKLPGL